MCVSVCVRVCVCLIALRLHLPSITAHEFPKQTLTSPYQRVFAVAQEYKGPQLGTEGRASRPLPNTSSTGKTRGRRRAPACFFLGGAGRGEGGGGGGGGVTALNKRSLSTAVSLAPLQLRGLKMGGDPIACLPDIPRAQCTAPCALLRRVLLCCCGAPLRCSHRGNTRTVNATVFVYPCERATGTRDLHHS